MSTFACPFSFEKGKKVSIKSGFSAVSACISPSTIRSGSAFCTRSTARRTLSENGWGAEPKFENESMATRGSMSKRRTLSAASKAISAKSSAVVSMFTVVSARK